MSKAPDSDKAENGGPSTVEQYLVKDPERFALNMARMIEQAGKAASAWADSPRQIAAAEIQREYMSSPLLSQFKLVSALQFRLRELYRPADPRLS